MGNSTSRVVGCFVPLGNGKADVDLDFLEPLDEGLGHSFCYVRQVVLDSPTITPSNSERFTIDSSTFDSETLSGSFRREIVEDPFGLQRPIKSFPETTFKTISGASVSANASTARTGNQSALFASDTQEPAASFESTSSFAAIPLQPVPRGSGGPLNGFMSGPLERGFASGPLEKGGGFMSGPMEKGGFMSGPLDSTDKANFSAPLVYSRRGPGLRRLVRSMSGPMKSALTRTFSRHSMRSGWMQRFFLHPVTQFVWHPKEPKFRPEAPQNCLDLGPSESDYRNTRNLQWAHGKAGEDRVHVVLSEEQGWLFVGIYDGFSGPDAPDYLMNHLYWAIDKELEGLLWYYEDTTVNGPSTSEFLDDDSVGFAECREDHLQDSKSSQEILPSGLEESLDVGTENVQVSHHEIMEGRDEVRERTEVQAASGNDEDPSTNPSVSIMESNSASAAKLVGQGRKSKRLYELLQMELSEVQGSTSSSDIGNRREGSSDLQSSSVGLHYRNALPEAQLMSCLVNAKGDGSGCSAADAIIVEEDGGTVAEESNPGATTSFSASDQRQSIKKPLFGSKIRKMYRKQKSLRKKLFPWNYDWHREETQVSAGTKELLGPMRRCKTGLVNHDAVLRAMAKALENTEEAYMEMVENTLDRNPELALMGSCVLVMLMKDQDVYVMNLGDSRVILAQERHSDRHPNPNLVKDDVRHWSRSRESLVRVELDRISEESPMHNPNSRVNKINKSREISLCRLKMRAIQLSTDHSTSIEEEVMRIKAEHIDDSQAILNDRVKGQLKVTRAFGAGFLKKPRCNEALLRMFQIDYMGTAPYISCIPSVVHHRLCSSDRFLVLSSDGLYQYFSNEEVISHVAWFIENVPEGDPAQYLIAELLFRAAKKNVPRHSFGN